MKNLVKLEFRKLRRNVAFYICLGCAVLVLVMGCVLALAAVGLLDEYGGGLYVDETALGLAFLTEAVSTAFYCSLAGIFISIFVCRDYSQRTIKNILARGYRRENVYFSKLLTCWVGATIMYVLVLCTGFFFSLPYLDSGYVDFGKLLAVLGVQYVSNMAYISLFFALASITGSNGLVIPVGICGPAVVDVILSVVYLDGDLARYGINSVVSDVNSINITTDRLVECLLLSLGYLVVFLGGSFLLSRRKEA